MNYASGLMLGLSLVQGLKGMTGNQGMFKPMTGMGGRKGGMFQGMGGGKIGTQSITDMFGGERGFNRSIGNGNDNFSKLYLQKYKPSAHEESFRLISALLGRRRYRAAGITEGLKKLIEHRFSELEYVKSIDVNPTSGSILVTFDEKDEESILRLEKWMKEKLFSNGDAILKHDVKMNQMLYGSITESVKNTVQHVSNMLIKESHGLLDIKSFLSIVFAVLGLRKVILNGEFPSGIQMLWWAVSLMRGVKAV